MPKRRSQQEQLPYPRWKPLLSPRRLSRVLMTSMHGGMSMALCRSQLSQWTLLVVRVVMLQVNSAPHDYDVMKPADQLELDWRCQTAPNSRFV